VTENSPQFQLRVKAQDKPSPGGTTEPFAHSFSAAPPGLEIISRFNPQLKLRAIFNRRSTTFGTASNKFVRRRKTFYNGRR